MTSQLEISENYILGTLLDNEEGDNRFASVKDCLTADMLSTPEDKDIFSKIEEMWTYGCWICTPKTVKQWHDVNDNSLITRMHDLAANYSLLTLAHARQAGQKAQMGAEGYEEITPYKMSLGDVAMAFLRLKYSRE